eukprot:CAMPEP_0204642780 /NCGR_PEP_ID=MMETSP0718-20130828/127_1 /ASSEMBLY_ACC=CAM_ASM_000674 /TAXON_ID=230516 /ORGANISM="Chaetoceros curvisetus" /LENGTH=292 /DNA_ID=CAMNT_0051663625 /DNA_START=68 /DNA_END=949 /DNA_ORIENTATION=-
MNMKSPTETGRLWRNRGDVSLGNGVYDDYDECVFPHLHIVPPIKPISGPRNECPLPPYLGPRDGTRNVFPCEYSISIPDEIGSSDHDDNASEVSFLSGYDADSSLRFISQGRNEFMPFLNYDNEVRVLGDPLYYHPSLTPTSRNSNTTFLNYFPTRRYEEVTWNYADNIESTQASVYSEDDDISYTTDGMTQTTCSSTNAGSKPPEVSTTLLPMEKNEEDKEVIGCILENKVLRDLSDFIEKVFGWRRQLPVLSCEPEGTTSSHDHHGYIPDIDDSSCSSASVAPIRTHWSR